MNDYGPKRFKRWGGVSPVGESQFQALENVDAPYLTIIGPGFEARKKGLFRELITTAEQVQIPTSFRASELVSSGERDVSGTFSLDGSLKFGVAKQQVARTRRTDEPYFPTCDWVSQDKRYRVAWISPARYAPSFLGLPGGSQPAAPQYFTGIVSRFGWHGWKAVIPRPITNRFWVNGVEYSCPGLVLGGCVIVREEVGESVPYVVLVGRDSLPTNLTTASFSETVDTVPNRIYVAPLQSVPLSFTSRAIPAAQFNQFTQSFNYLYRNLLSNWHFNSSGTNAVACDVGTRGYTILNVPFVGSVTATMNELPLTGTSSDTFAGAGGSVITLPFSRTIEQTTIIRRVWAADYLGDTLTLLTTSSETTSTEVTSWTLGAFNSGNNSWQVTQSSVTTGVVRAAAVLDGTETTVYDGTIDRQLSVTFTAGGSGGDGSGPPIGEYSDFDFLAVGAYNTSDLAFDELTIAATGIDLRAKLHCHDVIRESVEVSSNANGAATNNLISIAGNRSITRTDRLLHDSAPLASRVFDRGTFPYVYDSPAGFTITGYSGRDLSRLQVSGAWDIAADVGIVSIYSDRQEWSSAVDAREGVAYWLRDDEEDGLQVTELSTYSGKVLHGVCVVKSGGEGRP